MSAGESYCSSWKGRRERAKDTLWNKERKGGIPQRQGKGGEERERRGTSLELGCRTQTMSGSVVLLLLLLLLSLLALSTGSDTRRIRKRGLNQKDYEYPNHQSTQHQKNDRCPPPPQMLPERACEVSGCRSDSECERHKRCCYNGCIYACLESVQPPPVLDWLVQPKPRWLGGNGWLLDGPEEVLQAEACSTTEDGDEPLHCPTGYECHIINPGNPAAGIPNRGQCIKQRGNSDGRPRHKYFKDYKDYLGTSSSNAVGYEKPHHKHLG
ncbi:WAP four-disulfide core domain protein 1 [Clinocottus analis]|uniref:WAP four-disulfide core domain protein 1 n=1 Tax=Clinocottus analis TaxID=304258 RepID=UPI0035BF048F